MPYNVKRLCDGRQRKNLIINRDVSGGYCKTAVSRWPFSQTKIEMTPKEKANELMSKFVGISLSQVNDLVDGIRIRLAKESALIAVEEILKCEATEPTDTDWDECGSTAQYYWPQKKEDADKFWGEVKSELQSY